MGGEVSTLILSLAALPRRSDSVAPQGSRQARPARPSLDGELLPFSRRCPASNGRRTCAVTRRDSRLAAYFLPLTNRRSAVSPCCCPRLLGGRVFLGRKRTGPSFSRPVLAGRKPCPVSLRADAALPSFVRHRSGCRFFCVASCLKPKSTVFAHRHRRER